MSVVPAEIIVSEDVIKSQLLKQCRITVESLSLIGEGWDNVVYLVNKKWIFRFPRRFEAVDLISKEILILPLLAKHLPLEIPNPVFIGHKNSQIPAFYGHELIKGLPGSAVSLNENEYHQAAIDLGRFLKILHGLKVDDLGLSGKDFVRGFDRSDYLNSKRIFDERLKKVSMHFDLKKYLPKFDEICQQASTYKPKKATLIHGDMYHRHLIFDENRLSGVIDWGDCCLGDPVGDLGIIFQFFPKNTRESFFKSYGPVNEKNLNFARFIGLYLAMALLWYGQGQKDQDLIRTSMWTFDEI